MLLFRTVRKCARKRVENKIPIGLVNDFPGKPRVGRSRERKPPNYPRGFRGCVTFAHLSHHFSEALIIEPLEVGLLGSLDTVFNSRKGQRAFARFTSRRLTAVSSRLSSLCYQRLNFFSERNRFFSTILCRHSWFFRDQRKPGSRHPNCGT